MPKKTTRESSFMKENLPDHRNTKLSEQLTQIYQDKDGHLPDMKRIKIKKNNSGFKAFLVILFVGGLMAAAAWAGFFLMPNNKKFAEDQVNVQIDGPQNVMSGTATTYTISYENNQSIALKQATLNIQYPEGFVFVSSDLPSKNTGHTEWDLSQVGAHKNQSFTITGLTYGSLNQKRSWRVFLTYEPENFSSELQKSAFLDVTVAKSPFSLTLDAPSQTIVGNDSEYTFTLKKEEDSQINKLELKPQWPQNFFITSSSPALNKDNTWLIEPNKTGSSTTAITSWTFKINGKFSTSTEDPGDVSASLFTISNNASFALATTKATTSLSQNDLNFNLAINGSLANFSSQLGDNLNITLSLKNQSADDIKNATLKLTLDAPSAKKQSLLNWAKIADKADGDVRGTQISDNIRRGEISWSKAKIPSLAKIKKDDGVNVDLQLPIKAASSFIFSDSSTSTQITVIAEVSFTDANNVSHTYSSNPIIISLRSDLKFEARDTVSGSDNSQKHELNWILTNSFHPLKNLSLSADVYGDVSVDLPSPTPAGKADFDAANKKITWTIPAMPESVDTLALPITITLNKFNPTQELLVSKVHVQAEDAITGEQLNFMGQETGLNP